MGMKTTNPFSPRDLQLAQAVLDTCQQILDLYAKCTDCGLDVSDLQQQVAAQRDFAQGILRNFAQVGEHAGQ